MRQTLETVERQRQAQVNALHANGMIGGNDLAEAVNAINRSAHEARLETLRTFGVLSDEEVEDADFSMEPPMPTEVTDGG